MSARALGPSFLRALIAERTISVMTRLFTDVPMVAILAWDSGIVGISTAFIVVTPIYLMFCVGVVITSDLAHKRAGVALTGLETLREIEEEALEKKHWFRRMIRWILRSRRTI